MIQKNINSIFFNYKMINSAFFVSYSHILIIEIAIFLQETEYI